MLKVVQILLKMVVLDASSLIFFLSLQWLHVTAPDVTTSATSKYPEDTLPDPGLALEGNCVVVCDAVRLQSSRIQNTHNGFTKKSRRLAFSVVQMGTNAPSRGIMFDHLLVNVGNAYDMSRSIFTAPVSGVYSFQFTIFKVLNKRQLTVALTVSGCF